MHAPDLDAGDFQAVRHDPKHAETFVRRGDAWRAEGMMDQARANFSEALQLALEEARAYIRRGDLIPFTSSSVLVDRRLDEGG